MEYAIAPTKARMGLEGVGGFDPIDSWSGPNYKFSFNDGTGLGELHVMKLEIAMAEFEARRFAGADEPTRQAMLKPLIEAYESRKAAARKGAPR